MKGSSGIVLFAVLSAGCTAQADPGKAWESEYRAAYSQYLFARICREHGFDDRRLKALRREAAQKGYSAAVKRIEGEEEALRSKESIVCTADVGRG